MSAAVIYRNVNSSGFEYPQVFNTTVIPLQEGDGNFSYEKPSGLLRFSEEYMKYHGYFSAIVCAFGIFANLANIIVLTRKNMISSTNWILMWLAVADLLTMMSYFPVSIHFYVLRDPMLSFPETKSIDWIRFLLFHSSFTIVCHTIAIWLTITLAIFRYVFICFPTRGSQLCTLQRAKLAIFLVCFSTVIVCVPNFMTNDIDFSRHSRIFNASDPVYTIQLTALAAEHDIIVKINYWVQAIIVKLIPCFLLTCLTIMLILAMHNANKRRQKLKSQGRKDDSDRAREHNRTTGMLLAIVVLFLITELPQGIITLLNSFDEKWYRDVYLPLGDLWDIMALLNNSINFVLYCTMSRVFRDTFVKVFCGCCPERRPGWLKLRTFEHKNVNNDPTTTSTTTSSI
ncbi:G-protein coupled receptor dmsr-1-like isoform X2 [Lineus longissimus]|uniref:G-protein coupled receptor dmsr-1-like isoform X2 n=1 Tax=Lineus longissimus TaxID=88925 RepID=UPI00315D228E